MDSEMWGGFLLLEKIVKSFKGRGEFYCSFPACGLPDTDAAVVLL